MAERLVAPLPVGLLLRLPVALADALPECPALREALLVTLGLEELVSVTDAVDVALGELVSVMVCRGVPE